MGKALAGDFSQKLELNRDDANDPLARLTVLVRFLLDELEDASGRRSRDLERLKELDRMRATFVNTAAHELGTPLTPISIHLHMMANERFGPLTKGQEDSLRVMDRNLRRVVALVNDMLSISRMESGKMVLDRKAVGLGALVRDTQASFREMAAARGIRLEVVEGQPVQIVGDRTRLGQVLDNLVMNALKFTPSGGVVRLGWRRRGSEGIVTVTDDGVGLTTGEIAQLFRPFAKLADRSLHGDIGTGLGLYISRGIVERHGGILWVESQGKGKGTTAYVALPVEGTQAPAGSGPTGQPGQTLPAPGADQPPDASSKAPQGLDGGAPQHPSIGREP